MSEAKLVFKKIFIRHNRLPVIIIVINRN
jgi:hypothetical protein